MRKKTNSGTPHMPLRAAICFYRLAIALELGELHKGAIRAFVNPPTDDLKIGPRRDRQL